MPVYEQKLISPLAVRFTQEHIRTTFQDGRVVEDSIDEIKTRPAPEGSGYDLILETPFPCIEILRWRHPAPTDGKSQQSDSCQHWFSLDNRRLYCLQVAAMDHFPKRVAAEVDILYDSHKVWRKYDSTTFGRGVSIGRSCKGPEEDFWDWFMEAEATDTAAYISRSAAFVAAQKDDQRVNVDELVNASEEKDATGGALSSTLAQLARMEAQCKREESQCRCLTPDASTAFSEDSGSHTGCYTETSDSEVDHEGTVALSRVRECFARGTWDGSRGDSYTFHPGKKDGVWSCWRQESSGTSKSFTVSYDREYSLIWWGTAGTYFASAAQIVESPWEIKWYGSNDVNMRKPKFSWWAQADAKAINPVLSTKQQRSGGENAKPKSPNKSAVRNARRKA